MNKQEQKLLRSQMSELITTLQKWDYEYYILNNPSVVDGVYDQKLQDLKDLEKKSSLVLPNSPTNRINSKIYQHSKFKLVKRAIPMLSIDNTNNREGLLAFDKRVRRELGEMIPEYLCEPKIDGLSASACYQNHKLVQLSTRGNGWLGEDVTFNQKVIDRLPFWLPNRETCEIRGELYMGKREFGQLNAELCRKGLKELTNARNAAAGTLRALTVDKERKLYFSAYQYFGAEVKTQEECLEKLREDGFVVSSYRLCKNIETTLAYIEEISKHREELDFAIDGVVVKVNSYSQQKELGETSKFPRWSIAYKFTPLAAISTIRAINRAVSKNGRITYVAVIDEVKIAGSTIKNVTLHNFSFIRRKKLNIGDQVLISKAGDVIPQLTEVLINKVGDSWQAPSSCPSCNTELIWEVNYLYQICPSEECTERRINYLVFFTSRAAIDIKGVNRSIIEKLFEFGLVRRPYDFYNLNSKHAEFSKIEMFREKSVANLLAAIDSSRHKTLDNFITAFSIPLLSSVKAQKLAKIFGGDIKELLTFIKRGNFIFLKKELGEKTGSSIEKFFQNRTNLDNFEKTSWQMIFIK